MATGILYFDTLFSAEPRREKLYRPRRDFPACDYPSLYRFSEENVISLSKYVLGQEKHETRGGALSNMQSMRIFLRYMATCGSTFDVGACEGVSEAAVRLHVKTVGQKLYDVRNDWIKFPTSVREFHRAEDCFFPGCCGFIDASHFRCKQPTKPQRPECYWNRRKACYTINVQATCDNSGDFTSVDTSCPGTTHDSRMYRKSQLYQLQRKYGCGKYLLGDKGYAASPHIFPPVSLTY